MPSADQPWAIRRAAVASSRVDLGPEGGILWPRADFLELLGIVHPVVQAPMSGFTPPALVTAVCNAGGLGSIGCVGQPPDVVREQVAEVRHAKHRPINIQLFVHRNPQINPEATARV